VIRAVELPAVESWWIKPGELKACVFTRVLIQDYHRLVCTMADRTSQDLSPSEFVKNIHALGKKKDAEDAKRIAELESQIIVDRKLRAQRRAGEFTICLTR
jgi:hypothetical protein